ncbi:hypothetical protein [Salinicola tamaricis]|uniref:hypothetical protein n=1 Tax=Salinicola tamaricis TaxID=1771309 RepID=UPI001A914FDB|nr:hypothetical protein [Salinicola tamaricis]
MLLAHRGIEARKVVGSVDTSEFFVTVAGTLGFVLALGLDDIKLAVGGGVRPERPRCGAAGGVDRTPAAGAPAGGDRRRRHRGGQRTHAARRAGVHGEPATLTLALLVLGWIALVAMAVRRHRAGAAALS